MKTRTMCVAAMIVLLVCATVHAIGPTLMNFSGVLTNSGGAPQVGTFSVTFRIYDVAAGGAALWTETQNVTSVSGGRFSILLGSVTALTATTFSGDNRYLGITISGDAEMTPRTRIASVAYAFRLGTVDGAGGGQVIGGLYCGYGHTPGGGDNFIAGNSNTTAGYAASVTGGTMNLSAGSYAVVAGGSQNVASGPQAFIGCGTTNSSSGNCAFVGAGFRDSASGDFSFCAGGRSNTAAGKYSFVAGNGARASHDYSFVWDGDSVGVGGTKTISTGQGSFTARCPGGVTFYSNGIAAPDDEGVKLNPGSGSWSMVSDRNSKTDFEPVDTKAVLDNLCAIDIGTWRYKSQDPDIRHVGPTAQDFFAAFGVGEDDRHISTIDADGVALAAIQALNRRNQELEAQIAELRALIKK